MNLQITSPAPSLQRVLSCRLPGKLPTLCMSDRTVFPGPGLLMDRYSSDFSLLGAHQDTNEFRIAQME